jgi:hypothetical protein
MGRKKKEEAIEVVSNEPLRKCYDCIHWHQCKDGNNFDGAVDFSSGSCDHNVYSKVPPLFTCPGWASGNGEIADTLSLLMSHE